MSVPTCSGSGGGSFVGGGTLNVAGGEDSGVLSGYLNDACDAFSAIGAGYGNGIGGIGSFDEFIGGGTSNAVNLNGSDGFIGAGTANTVSNTNGFIGAGESNINSGYDGAVVAGISNSVSSGNYGFIGAGSTNTNTGGDSAIAGGYGNKIIVAAYAAIGAGYLNLIDTGGGEGAISGGVGNHVSGLAGSIGGGSINTVSGQYATIGGGAHNTASGTEATVPGGGANIASGYASFAAGYHADANQAGSFVWSDNSSSSLTKPTVARQFVARASGGVEFFSNAAMTTGVRLAAGGGSWASLSDRAVKTDVTPIDDAQVLNKVAAMPISEWSYISERGVRHVGPMAQDFYAAFGIGEDNKHITSIDEDGVALAAIKALHGQSRIALAATKALRRQNADLRIKVSALQHQMAAIKAQMAELTAKVALIH